MTDANLGVIGKKVAIPVGKTGLPSVIEPDGRPLNVVAPAPPTSSTGVAEVTLNATDAAVAVDLYNRGGANRIGVATGAVLAPPKTPR